MHALGELAQVKMCHVGRGHDPPGTVCDREPRELEGFEIVPRSVVDARQKMEMKFGPHLL
jgi:hypothetical protein